uniref:Protein kinase domain-containing protein n=1 Tax=Trypanosoma congolense (strain IL3000) TaxID=1068625 RepID=G0UYN8_TRYCI|nr:putative protein kinase [Trypanosoma congolense IL3000]
MNAETNGKDGGDDKIVMGHSALSLSDISSMRLDGCRVLPRRTNVLLRSSQYHHAFPAGEMSLSLPRILSPSGSGPPIPHHMAGYSHNFRDTVGQGTENYDRLLKGQEVGSLRSIAEPFRAGLPLDNSCRIIPSCASPTVMMEQVGRGAYQCTGSPCRKVSVASSSSPTFHSPVPDEPSMCLQVSVSWRFPTLGEKLTPRAPNLLDNQLAISSDERGAKGRARDADGSKMFNMSCPITEGDSSVGASEGWKNISVKRQNFKERYQRRLKCVYATYESTLAKGYCSVGLQSSPDGGAPSVEPHTRATRLTSLSMITTTSAAASSYYTLGEAASLPFANQRKIPVVAQSVERIALGSQKGHQQGSPKKMNPVILNIIKRRILLQMTIFSEFLYNCIARPVVQTMATTEVNQRHDEDEDKLPSAVSGCVGGVKLPANGELLKPLFNNVCGGSPSLSCEDSHVATPHPKAGDESQVSLEHMADEGRITTEERRTLTQVKNLTTKVHSLDSVTRTVDNEDDDLVVYVGMILMGWLEVVDLLGSGTFGQVFLCKDLRISSGTFKHPSEIEGDDFQYWQCSHLYIPFGDPSVAPSHLPLVAVKVVKSRELFQQQSMSEAHILVHVSSQTASQKEEALDQGAGYAATSFMDPPVKDPRCEYVGKILAHGMCFGHHCIVMERYGVNLFEYIMAREFRGLPLYQIQDIGRKILQGLTLLHGKCHVAHCDVKPENVLLAHDSWLPQNLTHMEPRSVTEKCATNPIRAASAGSPRSQLHKPLGKSSSSVPLNSCIQSQADEDIVHASTPSGVQLSTTVGKSTKKSFLVEVEPVSTTTDASDGPQDATDSGKRMHPPADDFPSLLPLNIKLIDFSSSFYIGEDIYTYVQSRYYRAPEVIIGARYGPPIDIWSTGCLLAELMLGLPLLPGDSDHHQLHLMEEMLGPLPHSLLKNGAFTFEYYDVEDAELRDDSTCELSCEESGRPLKPPSFKLLTEEEYVRRHPGAKPSKGKRYFQFHTLAELIRVCMISKEDRCIALGHSPRDAADDELMEKLSKKQPVAAVVEEMKLYRFRFYDLIKKMLHGDPEQRLTAHEALGHSFFSSTPQYMRPYIS